MWRFVVAAAVAIAVLLSPLVIFVLVRVVVSTSIGIHIGVHVDTSVSITLSPSGIRRVVLGLFVLVGVVVFWRQRTSYGCEGRTTNDSQNLSKRFYMFSVPENKLSYS